MVHLVAIEFQAVCENNIIAHRLFILYICMDVQETLYAIDVIKQTEIMTPKLKVALFENSTKHHFTFDFSTENFELERTIISLKVTFNSIFETFCLNFYQV